MAKKRSQERSGTDSYRLQNELDWIMLSEHASVKPEGGQARMLKPVHRRNPYENMDRECLEAPRQRGSLKRAPLHENLNQISKSQAMGESESSHSEYEDFTQGEGASRLAGEWE